jgi:hypothetical protein
METPNPREMVETTDPFKIMTMTWRIQEQSKYNTKAASYASFAAFSQAAISLSAFFA